MTGNPPARGESDSTDRSAEDVAPPGSAPPTGPRRRLVLLALTWSGMLLVTGAVLAGKIQPDLVHASQARVTDCEKRVRQ